MAPRSNPELLAILYAALHSELGMFVRTAPGEAVRLRTHLHSARTFANDRELSTLTFTHNPRAMDSELWIIKRPALAESSDLVLEGEYEELPPSSPINPTSSAKF